MDKVLGGTPTGSRSLCATCRAAHIVRGLNMQQVVMCRQTNPQIAIRFPVETCSVYDDKRTPSLYQMEQIAWQIQSRSRGPTGFAQENIVEVTISPPVQQPGQPTCPPPITG